MKKSIRTVAVLVALILPMLPPASAALRAEIRVTGKKMEIMPRSDTTIFSDGAFVEHSSFTMKASRIVSRDSNRRIEARGDVVVVSVDGSDELLGEEGEYSSKTGLGSLKGAPAYMRTKGSDGSVIELATPLIDWSSSTVTARGDSLLKRERMKVSSSMMTYDRRGKIFMAGPVKRLLYEDEKHSADFRADRMTYFESAGLAKLSGGVRGKIITKPAPKGKVSK